MEAVKQLPGEDRLPPLPRVPRLEVGTEREEWSCLAAVSRARSSSAAAAGRLDLARLIAEQLDGLDLLALAQVSRAELLLAQVLAPRLLGVQLADAAAVLTGHEACFEGLSSSCPGHLVLWRSGRFAFFSWGWTRASIGCCSYAASLEGSWRREYRECRRCRRAGRGCQEGWSCAASGEAAASRRCGTP